MGQVNDGGLPFGSRKVKFYPIAAGVDGNGNSQWNTVARGIYILESFTPTRPMFKVNRYDENRNPNGAIGVDDFVEASAVVQLANINTAQLQTGDAFCTVLPSSPGGVAEGFWVTSADEPESQNDVRKQNVRLQKIVSATPPASYP